MAESFVSLSVENDDVKCLVYNRKVQKKKEKVQKLSPKKWGNFIEKSKQWTNVKPVDDEYSSLTVVYDGNRNVEKLYVKVLTNCRTLFS